MRHLRRINTATLILAGLALTAALYGADRAAITILVVVVILNAIGLEALRAQASRENRP